MFWTNYHTHCVDFDCSESTEAYILAAQEQGVRSLGFSSPAPMPVEAPWSMPPARFPEYLSHISRLRTRYQDNLQIYLGLEIDYLPGVSWWDTIGGQLRQVDYTLGAIHFVENFDDGKAWEISRDPEIFAEGLERIFKGDVRAAVSRYYELLRWMVMLENPDIVAHLDLIKIPNTGNAFFVETEAWYRLEIEKTLKVIANMGSIIEVNTRGLYTGHCLDLYPSQWILEKALAKGIPVTLSSGAHQPGEITAGFDFAAKILNKIGYTHTAVLLDGRWTDVRFGEMGLELPTEGRRPKTA